MDAIPYEANYEQNPSPLSLHTKNFLDAIKNNSPESLNCGIAFSYTHLTLPTILHV